MRNRIVTTQLTDVSNAGDGSSSKHAVLTRVRHTFITVIDWLRAGYPDDAPRTGYSPLLALNGPIALTPRQTEHVINELGGRPITTTDLEVAITKATNRLPTPTETHAFSRALRHRTSEQ